ncbi:MAG: hypothetical protein AABZ06_15185 [Bdellovibrionota bacterium]
MFTGLDHTFQEGNKVTTTSQRFFDGLSSDLKTAILESAKKSKAETRFGIEIADVLRAKGAAHMNSIVSSLRAIYLSDKERDKEKSQSDSICDSDA